MKMISACHIERASESEPSYYENCSSIDDSLWTDVGHLPMKSCITHAICNHRLCFKKKWIHAHYGYRVIRVRRLTARDRQQQTVNSGLSRHYFLCLAMPNCLADNITGHSCDPYVFLRDRRLYLFYIANILVKRRR